MLVQLAAHLGAFLAIAAAVAVADHVMLAPLVRLTTACKVLVASGAMYCRLLLLDYDRMEGEATVGQPSYLRVQDALRLFLDLSTYEYAEDAPPFPADDLGSDTSEDDVWRDVGGGSEETHGFGGSDLGLSVAAGSGNSSPMTVPHGGTDGASRRAAPSVGVVAALGGSTGIFGMVSARKPPGPLHPTLVEGACFDNCEFNDVSKEARALYTCRATTHPLKVGSGVAMPGTSISRPANPHTLVDMPLKK